MKFDVINISSKGEGMDAALAEADHVAKELGLKQRDAQQMRLLSEELMGAVRSIIGDLEGKFWIETDGMSYQLYLQIRALLDPEQRAQLLSVSTSGKNEAFRGLLGKIFAYFDVRSIENDPMLLIESTTSGTENGDLTWSLEAYRERLRNREEWDELEKSVIAHLADNIEVSVRGYDAQIMVFKELGRGHEI